MMPRGPLAPDPFTPERVADLVERARRAEASTPQGRGIQRRGDRGERYTMSMGPLGMSRSRVAARYVAIAGVSDAEAARVFGVSPNAVGARRRRNRSKASRTGVAT